jgi:protein-tyrosine phosphatase
MIDLHCHILPGIDDGSDNIIESLTMARLAIADGVTTVVATPHKGTASYDPPSGTIRNLARDLRGRLEDEGIALELLIGCELAATSDIEAFAENGQLIPLGDNGRFLLIELPFTGHLGSMQQQFFDLEIAGYRIMLAHPERSMACQSDPKLLATLHDRGYWVQINAGSLAGKQGRRIRNLCIRWLREGVIDVIASDGHDTTHRPPTLSPARSTVLKVAGEELWEQLTVTNPRRVLDTISE